MEGDLQSKLRNFSWLVYLPSEPLPEICWEEVAEEIYIFINLFLCLTWDLKRGLASNKPSNFRINYGGLVDPRYSFIIHPPGGWQLRNNMISRC